MGEIVLKTKYDIGDKFFCAFNAKRVCPYCKQSYPHYEVAELKISNIGFYNGGSSYYSVDVYVNKNHTFSTSFVSEYNFCKTREEAQRKCDRANSEYLKAKFHFKNEADYFA